MEFKEEFIKEQEFSPEQVAALKTTTDTHEADLKKGWDDKATTNAEAIIEGAGKKTVTMTGIARNEGEKWADYLTRSSDLFFEGTKSSLDRKIIDLDKKIKEGGGDAILKQELTDTKEQLDKLKIKEAQFADYEENDYKGKLEEANKNMSGMQRRIAFNSVKPSFPDTANAFEVKAKWAEFQKTTEEKYNIVLDEDNEPWAIDKTNEHKRFKLGDLATKDETIAALTQGRQQTGTGATGVKGKVKIEGVPFEVPENATAKERQAAVKDYLAGQNIPKMSPEYAKQFSKLNQKILGKTPAKE
jgi:hypothetical protein